MAWEWHNLKKMLQICLYFAITASLFTGCGKIGTQVSWTDKNLETETEERQSDSEKAAETVRETESEDVTEDTKEIAYVDLCGAVRTPGVYIVSSEARICDVIEMAGGLTEDADLTRINQALPVEDGMKIRVYTTSERDTESEGTSAGKWDGTTGIWTEDNREHLSDPALVDLNTAGLEELQTLPGIGESRARDIIEYREINGSFQSVEEIMNISGIKTAVFEKIKDKIVVR